MVGFIENDELSKIKWRWNNEMNLVKLYLTYHSSGSVVVASWLILPSFLIVYTHDSGNEVINLPVGVFFTRVSIKRAADDITNLAFKSFSLNKRVASVDVTTSFRAKLAPNIFRQRLAPK